MLRSDIFQGTAMTTITKEAREKLADVSTATPST